MSTQIPQLVQSAPMTFKSRATRLPEWKEFAPTVAFCDQLPCQVSQVSGEIRMATAFAVNREAVTKRAFHQNR